MIENANIEFKESYTKKILESVVAFLNTSGGEIYIGINDEGNVTDLKNIDEVVLKSTNSIINSIVPNPIPYVRVSPEKVKGKNVIKILIIEGSQKPYYIYTKGLKSSGVYVRVGSSNQQTSTEQIRALIKESDQDIFIESLSTIQDLTFYYTNKYFVEHNIAFSDNEKISLGFMTTGGLYTNLGLLLSDQNPYTIKFSAFQGTDKTIFLDRKEFTGSVLEQLESAMSTFKIYNRTPSIIEGLIRKDHPNYSEKAVREGLLNSIIHRDYNFRGAVLFNMFDDRIEIMSLGGLIKGLDTEVIVRGVSETRNYKLSQLFYRLGLVEAYGTGIPRIYAAYKETNLTPKIEVFNQAFNLILPNKNIADNIKKDNKVVTHADDEKIINYLRENESITKEIAGELLKVKPNTAHRKLKNLSERGLLEIKIRERRMHFSLLKYSD